MLLEPFIKLTPHENKTGKLGHWKICWLVNVSYFLLNISCLNISHLSLTKPSVFSSKSIFWNFQENMYKSFTNSNKLKTFRKPLEFLSCAWLHTFISIIDKLFKISFLTTWVANFFRYLLYLVTSAMACNKSRFWHFCQTLANLPI